MLNDLNTSHLSLAQLQSKKGDPSQIPGEPAIKNQPTDFVPSVSPMDVRKKINTSSIFSSSISSSTMNQDINREDVHSKETAVNANVNQQQTPTQPDFKITNKSYKLSDATEHILRDNVHLFSFSKPNEYIKQLKRVVKLLETVKERKEVIAAVTFNALIPDATTDWCKNYCTMPYLAPEKKKKIITRLPAIIQFEEIMGQYSEESTNEDKMEFINCVSAVYHDPTLVIKKLHDCISILGKSIPEDCPLKEQLEKMCYLGGFVFKICVVQELIFAIYQATSEYRQKTRRRNTREYMDDPFNIPYIKNVINKMLTKSTVVDYADPVFAFSLLIILTQTHHKSDRSWFNADRKPPQFVEVIKEYATEQLDDTVLDGMNILFSKWNMKAQIIKEGGIFVLNWEKQCNAAYRSNATVKTIKQDTEGLLNDAEKELTTSKEKPTVTIKERKITEKAARKQENKINKQIAKQIHKAERIQEHINNQKTQTQTRSMNPPEMSFDDNDITDSDEQQKCKEEERQAKEKEKERIRRLYPDYNIQTIYHRTDSGSCIRRPARDCLDEVGRLKLFRPGCQDVITKKEMWKEMLLTADVDNSLFAAHDENAVILNITEEEFLNSDHFMPVNPKLYKQRLMRQVLPQDTDYEQSYYLLKSRRIYIFSLDQNNNCFDIRKENFKPEQFNVPKYEERRQIKEDSPCVEEWYREQDAYINSSYQPEEEEEEADNAFAKELEEKKQKHINISINIDCLLTKAGLKENEVIEEEQETHNVEELHQHDPSELVIEEEEEEVDTEVEKHDNKDSNEKPKNSGNDDTISDLKNVSHLNDNKDDLDHDIAELNEAVGNLFNDSWLPDIKEHRTKERSDLLASLPDANTFKNLVEGAVARINNHFTCYGVKLKPFYDLLRISEITSELKLDYSLEICERFFNLISSFDNYRCVCAAAFGTLANRKVFAAHVLKQILLAHSNTCSRYNLTINSDSHVTKITMLLETENGINKPQMIFETEYSSFSNDLIQLIAHTLDPLDHKSGYINLSDNNGKNFLPLGHFEHKDKETGKIDHLTVYVSELFVQKMCNVIPYDMCSTNIVSTPTNYCPADINFDSFECSADFISNETRLISTFDPIFEDTPNYVKEGAFTFGGLSGVLINKLMHQYNGNILPSYINGVFIPVSEEDLPLTIEQAEIYHAMDVDTQLQVQFDIARLQNILPHGANNSTKNLLFYNFINQDRDFSIELGEYKQTRVLMLHNNLVKKLYNDKTKTIEIPNTQRIKASNIFKWIRFFNKAFSVFSTVFMSITTITTIISAFVPTLLPLAIILNKVNNVVQISAKVLNFLNFGAEQIQKVMDWINNEWPGGPVNTRFADLVDYFTAGNNSNSIDNFNLYQTLANFEDRGAVYSNYYFQNLKGLRIVFNKSDLASNGFARFQRVIVPESDGSIPQSAINLLNATNQLKYETAYRINAKRRIYYNIFYDDVNGKDYFSPSNFVQPPYAPTNTDNINIQVMNSVFISSRKQLNKIVHAITGNTVSLENQALPNDTAHFEPPSANSQESTIQTNPHTSNDEPERDQQAKLEKSQIPLASSKTDNSIMEIIINSFKTIVNDISIGKGEDLVFVESITNVQDQRDFIFNKSRRAFRDRYHQDHVISNGRYYHRFIPMEDAAGNPVSGREGLVSMELCIKDTKAGTANETLISGIDAVDNGLNSDNTRMLRTTVAERTGIAGWRIARILEAYYHTGRITKSTDVALRLLLLLFTFMQPYENTDPGIILSEVQQPSGGGVFVDQVFPFNWYPAGAFNNRATFQAACVTFKQYVDHLAGIRNDNAGNSIVLEDTYLIPVDRDLASNKYVLSAWSAGFLPSPIFLHDNNMASFDANVNNRNVTSGIPYISELITTNKVFDRNGPPVNSIVFVQVDNVTDEIYEMIFPGSNAIAPPVPDHVINQANNWNILDGGAGAYQNLSITRECVAFYFPALTAYRHWQKFYGTKQEEDEALFIISNFIQKFQALPLISDNGRIYFESRAGGHLNAATPELDVISFFHNTFALFPDDNLSWNGGSPVRQFRNMPTVEGPVHDDVNLILQGAGWLIQSEPHPAQLQDPRSLVKICVLASNKLGAIGDILSHITDLTRRDTVSVGTTAARAPDTRKRKISFIINKLFKMINIPLFYRDVNELYNWLPCDGMWNAINNVNALPIAVAEIDDITICRLPHYFIEHYLNIEIVNKDVAYSLESMQKELRPAPGVGNNNQYFLMMDNPAVRSLSQLAKNYTFFSFILDRVGAPPFSYWITNQEMHPFIMFYVDYRTRLPEISFCSEMGLRAPPMQDDQNAEVDVPVRPAQQINPTDADKQLKFTLIKTEQNFRIKDDRNDTWINFDVEHIVTVDYIGYQSFEQAIVSLASSIPDTLSKSVEVNTIETVKPAAEKAALLE